MTEENVHIPARRLPTGTVTFLLTDIEGSTRLWEENPPAMSAALAEQDRLLAAEVRAHAGAIVYAASILAEVSTSA
jgi:class 3 adenylate cyclase